MNFTEAPARKRILFVDDEQHVLDGLQNLLRKQRRQWDMVFVSSGEAALEELGRNPFDVVVSDMRMPRMDGATLLRKVKENHPSAARIVLSGHAERDAVLKALPVAHQYLSKPCDPELIRVVIERACALQSLLSSDTIRALIGGMEKLPSVPQTYWELTRALTDPDIGVPEIARIV
ncbi:MAG: response regulator, partial [Pseudomonadota bacterium]